MKKIKCLTLLICLVICLTAKAEVYLIDSGATTAGAQITYRNQTFTVGTTAFASFDQLAAVSVPSNSTVYVAPGTYSGGTLSVFGLKLLGANAYCDWTATRSAESTINGILYVNASKIEVNGFAFTGEGRVVANSATNQSPIYSLKVSYNVFSGSTVARNDNTHLIAIGTRYADGNANADVSQRRYCDTEVSHNRFTGSATHLANSIGVMGVFGTTTVTDNYLYDGGTGVHVCNGQGVINISHNKFHYVGVSTSANTDGNGVGSFSVYAERSAYANSTTLNITDNDFDHCYGRTSYMALLRIYPGSSGSTNCVAPVNMSVNINRNTFTNKTSKSTNSGQLGENVLLYSDLGTTPDVRFNIADNHYDNRFYKYSYVTLRDGLGQREIYSNSADQFVIAGKYSTMGTSTRYGSDISNHLVKASTPEATVIQSMDIDPATGDIYVLQLKGSSNKSSFCSANGLSTECDPLTITRIPCTSKATKTSGSYTYSTSVQKMSIAKTGHGVKLSVYRDTNGQLWLITGAKGSDNGTSNDLSGKAICRFKFVSGQTIIADGRENSKVSLSYYNHPKAYNNAYADVDPLNRYICFSSSGNGRRYCIYDLDDFFNGKLTEIRESVVYKGDSAISGSGISGDTGFEYKSYQSFSICGDYLYLFEGVGATSATSTFIMSTYNWRTQQYLQRKSLTYDRLVGSSAWNEPEAVSIRPDIFGNATMYIGMSPSSGYISVYKLHVDRYVDSSGNVLGDDTSDDAKHFNTAQYSGITMSKSAGAYSLTAAALTDAPSQKITITRKSKYMYGKWTGCITGADGNVFSVDISDHNEYSGSFDATVTFTPDGLKNSYSANLRLSSPHADDIIIPINATYSGTVDPTPDPTPEPAPFDDNITEMTEVWNFSGNASLGSWLDISGTGDYLRTIAFKDGKIYALHCKTGGTPAIKIIDAYTGAQTGSLSVNGIQNALFKLSGIAVIGGKIVASSISSAGTNFYIYIWDDDSSDPQALVTDSTHDGEVVGAQLSVSGDLNNGRLWINNDGTSKLLYYTVTNGTASQTPTVINLTKSGAAFAGGNGRGSAEVIYNSDGTIWLAPKDAVPTLFDASGAYKSSVNSGVVSGNQYGTAMKIIPFGEKKYLAATAYKSGTNNGGFTLTNVTDGVESASSNLFFYPQAGLGATSNDQRLTSLCYATRNDGHVLDIWVSAAKQGVAYYTYNGESQSSSVEAISAGAMRISYNGREVSVAGSDAARISVYSTSGAMVAEVRGENTLNVSLLARGMYIVRALDREGNVATRKIMR